MTKGTVDLTNPTKIEPFFDVEAETHVRVPGETYRITIQLTGTTAQLQPTLSSDPPLSSQTEILNLLLSDVHPNEQNLGNAELRAVTNPNELQTDILTTRATQLLAGPLSSQVGRVVEQTLGVDTFQLSPSLFDPYGGSPSATTTTAVNPTVARDDRQADFRSGLPDVLPQPQLRHQRSDPASRVPTRATASRGFSRATRDQSYALEFSMRHTF